MPNRYVIANWKMNVPPEGLDAYMRALEESVVRVQVVVAPPFVYIPEVRRRASAVAVGAQNCADQKSGAFTGEVSAGMLRGQGVSFAIVGHSERRSLYQETDALVARRLAAAAEEGLTPVLCVGEDLRVREEGRADAHIANQIRSAASPALEKAGQVIIAYEPIWAIGTGRNATGAMVAETLRELREAVARFWPVRHRATPVLYGGSVTPDNVDDLVENGTADGFLVGGASLDSRKFLGIANAFGPS